MLSELACPAREKLEQFVAGELSEEELDQLSAHLERCTSCADQLEDMPAFRDGFAALCRDIRAAPCAWTENLSPPAQTGRPPLPQRVGRYRLEEEIGGGAMGRIVRVVDENFDRPLAMKILRIDRGTSAALEQRFLWEARLTGQMQHPGIPPVQEMGRLDDGRPYYVMKLVKGHSLEAMLKGRSSPGQDLPRYIAIFEQVCQTLAYAHSRNVIHRDLKPDNIMVGAFGEVQVMDWGLAKLIAAPGRRPDPAADTELGTVFALPTSASERSTAVGVVMGTPAYMPPEQARGEIEKLDQRSDVFGLGGILCTILCGKPPFVGGSNALHQSMQGAVADAFARLDGCDVDLELITLSKKCLAPSQNERPAHAGAVADAISDYQVILQQRMHQAEIDKAAAVIKAEEAEARGKIEKAKARAERKRRRTAIALAAAIVLMVVGTSAAGLWYETERERQQSETRRTISEILGKATALAEQARQMPLATSQEAATASQRWNQAATALAAADPLLRTGMADEPLRQLVEQVRLQIAQGQQQTEESEAKRARQEKLLEALDDARMARATVIGNDFDFPGAAAKYESAFLAYDLALKPGRAPELAQRIRSEEPAIREALLVALNDWAFVAARAQTEPTAASLGSLAAAADDDLWRKRIRAAPDRSALRELSAEDHSIAPSGLELLAIRLLENGDRDDALVLLRRGRDRHPKDFYFHFLLGSCLGNKTTVEIEEAVGCFRAALAIRPDASAAHSNLGNRLAAKNQLAEATAEYRLAIKLSPTFAAPHINLGLLLKSKNQLAEAIAEYEEAITLDSRSAPAHLNLGIALLSKNVDEDLDFTAQNISLGTKVQVKNLEDAIAEFEEAIKIDASNAIAHFSRGVALQAREQLPEAIVEFKKAIQYQPDLTSAHRALGVALDMQGKPHDAVAAFKMAVKCDPNLASAHVDLGMALGKIEGQLDNSIACCRHAIKLDPKHAHARNNLGIALVRKFAAQQNPQLLEEAITECRIAVNLKPKNAIFRAALGEALLAEGSVAEARITTQAALDMLPPNHQLLAAAKDLLKECDHWLTLEKHLLDVLAGEGPPPKNDERIDLIKGLCRKQRRNVAAVRLYSDAFRENPTLADDMVNHHRFNAALHAALAAAGHGRDVDKLDDQERGRLRSQALDWLRADLDLWEKRLETGKPEDRKLVQNSLQYWQNASYLATVRDFDALKKLPASEQLQWLKLWARVVELGCKAGS